MKTYWILFALTLICAVCVLTGDVIAQGAPPPHPPGTICFTRILWCWAQPAGPPGSPCGCPSPYGWIRGIRG